MNARVSFVRMEDATAEDWRTIGGEFMLVQHHGIFQGDYFFHPIGLDRDLREQFRGHANFTLTEEFCALYDDPAYDPQAETLPISEVEPMVRRVFSHVRQSVYKSATSVVAN